MGFEESLDIFLPVSSIMSEYEEESKPHKHSRIKDESSSSEAEESDSDVSDEGSLG